jgi:hypothetical protein
VSYWLACLSPRIVSAILSQSTSGLGAVYDASGMGGPFVEDSAGIGL